MKLFLLKDIKGQGKAGEVIEVKNGYAQFLLKNNSALDYERNASKVNQIIEAKIETEAAALQLANQLADDISKVSIKLVGKLSPKGSLINKITKNDILSELPNDLCSVIDKTMLQMDHNISTLGTFDIPVRLHKQVTGNLRVIIEEGK